MLPTHGLLKTKAIVGENVDSTCKTWLVISCDVTAKGAKRKNVAVIHTLQPNYRFPGITTLCRLIPLQRKHMHTHTHTHTRHRPTLDMAHACQGELQTLNVPTELLPHNVAQGAHPTFRACLPSSVQHTPTHTHTMRTRTHTMRTRTHTMRTHTHTQCSIQIPTNTYTYTHAPSPHTHTLQQMSNHASKLYRSVWLMPMLSDGRAGNRMFAGGRGDPQRNTKTHQIL